MLTNSLSTTQVGQCRYTPGRGGGRRAAHFKDLRPPGLSGGRALCAPSHQRQCVASPAPVVVSSAGSGDHDIRYFHRGGVRVYSWAQSCHHAEPQCFSTVISRIQRPCSASILPPYAAPLRGRPGRDSSSSAGSGRRVPSLHSKVEFNMAAIPPHLRWGSPQRKCSGRPGHGRPGRWRRQCPSSRLCVRCFAPATNPCCPPQTARFCPHQRCSVLLLFEGLCLFAFTLAPRSTVSAALTPLGRSGPGRRGRLPTHSAGLFRCSREPKVSLPRRSRARRPPLQDRLPGHAPLASLVPRP